MKRRLAALLLWAVCLPSCERGCLWRQLSGGFSATPSTETRARGGERAPGPASFGEAEVDCPDGLARCMGGVVQVSRLARRPSPCRGSPESCACPWAVLDRCPSAACVADGLTTALPVNRAAKQLCAPGPVSAPFSRPGPPSNSVLPPLPEACEAAAFVCLGALVVACEPSPRAVGTCIAGCTPEPSLDGPASSGLSDLQALALLCER